jgi:hypothetical protein
VLLTASAMLKDPVEHHKLLPTVTFPGRAAHTTAWGTTLKTRRGDRIYTSFAAPGFIVPAAWFYVAGAPPSREGLLGLNVTLGAISSLLFIVVAILIGTTPGGSVSVAGLLVAGLLTIASAEVLVSHGLTYWSLSLFQVVWAAFLIALTLYARHPEDRRYRTAVAVALFACCIVDWSGFVLGGVLGVAVWRMRSFAAFRALAPRLFGAVFVGGIAIMAHLASGVSLRQVPAILALRAGSRSVYHASVSALARGYVDSFGGFLILAAVATAILWRKRSTLSATDKLVLFATVAVLGENLLLTQHATEFSFDRLKFVAFLVVAVTIAWARSGRVQRVALAAVALASALIGVMQYRADLASHAAWALTDGNNRALLESASRLVDMRCADVYSRYKVRGYLPFTLGRSAIDMELGFRPRGGVGDCGRVTILGSESFTDLPAFSAVLVEQPSGASFTLR